MSIDNLDRQVDTITDIMQEAALTLQPPRTPSKRTVPWWSPDCRYTLDNLQHLPDHSPIIHRHLHNAFQWAVHKVKLAFYSERCVNAQPGNIWKMAWAGCGICTTPIPSL